MERKTSNNGGKFQAPSFMTLNFKLWNKKYRYSDERFLNSIHYTRWKKTRDLSGQLSTHNSRAFVKRVKLCFQRVILSIRCYDIDHLALSGRNSSHLRSFRQNCRCSSAVSTKAALEGKYVRNSKICYFLWNAIGQGWHILMLVLFLVGKWQDKTPRVNTTRPCLSST